MKKPSNKRLQNALDDPFNWPGVGRKDMALNVMCGLIQLGVIREKVFLEGIGADTSIVSLTRRLRKIARL